MSDQSTGEKGFETTWPFVLPNVAETFQFQMRAMLQEQAELLDETQKVMAAWTKRRLEAMEASFRTFQAICGCKDAGAMTSAYREWLTNSMNRIFADVNDTRDEALRLAEVGQKSVVALFASSLALLHHCGNGNSANQRWPTDQGCSRGS